MTQWPCYIRLEIAVSIRGMLIQIHTPSLQKNAIRRRTGATMTVPAILRSGMGLVSTKAYVLQ